MSGWSSNGHFNAFISSTKVFVSSTKCIKIKVLALYLASDPSHRLWMSTVWSHVQRWVAWYPWYKLYLEASLETHRKRTKIKGKVLQNFISSMDGTVKSTKTRQGWKCANRLAYFRTMVEKKDKKATLHLLHNLSWICGNNIYMYIYNFMYLSTYSSQWKILGVICWVPYLTLH